MNCLGVCLLPLYNCLDREVARRLVSQNCSCVSICLLSAPNSCVQVTEAYVDEKNLVVTAPAYMKAGTVGEIFDSVGAMVSAVLKLASK